MLFLSQYLSSFAYINLKEIRDRLGEEPAFEWGQSLGYGPRGKIERLGSVSPLFHACTLSISTASPHGEFSMVSEVNQSIGGGEWGRVA